MSFLCSNKQIAKLEAEIEVHGKVINDFSGTEKKTTADVFSEQVKLLENRLENVSCFPLFTYSITKELIVECKSALKSDSS